MNRWTATVAAMLFIMLVALGCSGNGSPVTPGSELTPDAQATGSSSNTYLWGYYDVTIDTTTGEIIAVPDRTTQFAANVVTFLNGNPTAMVFTMNDLDTSDPTKVTVDIDVTLSHPFSGMPEFNGYDVRGIFLGNGTTMMKYNTKLKFAKAGTDQYMVAHPVEGTGGPDGYTRWFNAIEFTVPGVLGYTVGKFATPKYTPTSTLNPYKYFADGIGKHESAFDFLLANADGNGEFKSGSTNTRNYYLEFPLPEPAAKFGYAVVANWESSTVHPSNALETAAMNVELTPNIYFVSGTDKGGKLILTMDIWNWHEQPSLIKVESSVLSVVATFDPSTIVTGGGDHYSTYHVEIPANVITHNSETGGDGWYFVITEHLPHTYVTDGVTPPGGAPLGTLAAFFGGPLFIASEPYCTDPIVTEMQPNKGTIFGKLNDVKIIGDEMEDGEHLACWLTNGTIDIPGTDVKWVSAQECTADFDFGAAGAEVGMYNLHFVDGDGCEVVLVDAMELIALFTETFDSSPSDWTYAYYQYWSGCSNGTVKWTANAPFGPSGSGNIRYPETGNYSSGGELETVVSVPFEIPSGSSEVRLRIYACTNFGGSWSYYHLCNFKIVESSTPGLSPFISGNPASLPPGGAYLANDTTHGSTWGPYGYPCGYGPLANQPGWEYSKGGGAFPSSLDQYLDLIIPASFHGKTVKVAFQWHPDWCGYSGYNSGFAMDDWEVWLP
ncbi:MAG TPA: hypothetical protein ENN67_00320 [Firmicutes bacterium]|nr:hypothetical protein [Bacillota bacterium]